MSIVNDDTKGAWAFVKKHKTWFMVSGSILAVAFVASYFV